MIEGFFIGDKPGLPEFLAGLRQASWRHGQTLDERRVGIEAQPLGIGGSEEKEIKRKRLGIAALDIVLLDQPLVDPAELLEDFTDPRGA